VYVYSLYSGGGPGNERGVISLSHSSINITIRTNDNPNGVMAFNDDSRELIVAEDVIGELVNSTTATFTVSRKQGLFGHVKVSEFQLILKTIFKPKNFNSFKIKKGG